MDPHASRVLIIILYTYLDFFSRNNIIYHYLCRPTTTGRLCCRVARAYNSKIYNNGRCPIGRELRKKRGKIRQRGWIILRRYFFFTHARAHITCIVDSYIYIYIYGKRVPKKHKKIYTDGRGMRLLRV